MALRNLGKWLAPPPPYYAAVFGDSSAAAEAAKFTVKLSTGQAVGRKVPGGNRDIFNLRGVPFARAGRLEAPAATKPWEGVLDCTCYGPAQPQGVVGSRALFVSMSTSLSEGMLPPMPDNESYTYGQLNEGEMLNLNVWTPGIGEGKRPVMVWLHGGKFQMGSNIECGIYDGGRLADRGDVVVVTLNYRFGAFAMSIPGGTQNISMRDMIAGLEWVQREISSLGGDPKNVTIFGESAGGIAVTNLLASPYTSGKGLFHKAVCSSGSPLTIDQHYHAKVNEAAQKALGLTELTKEGVQHATEAQLIKASGAMDDIIAKGFPTCAPVRDGEYVHAEGALAALQAGVNKDVPFIVGNNKDELAILFQIMGETVGNMIFKKTMLIEGGLKYLDSVMNRPPQESTKQRAELLLEQNKQALEKEGCTLDAALVGQKTAELAANEGGNFLAAEAHSKAGGKSYLYEFSAPSADGRMSHGHDLCFLWPVLQGASAEWYGNTLGYKLPIASDVLVHADAWQDAHTAFARTGQPSGVDGITWEPFPRRLKVEMGASKIEDALTPSVAALQAANEI